MGKGMCEFKFSPSKIEYSNEDKVIFLIDFLVCTIFFNFYFTYSNIIFIFFSKTFVHNLTFSFVAKFSNKIILFQEALQFKEIIILCYSR
jgi:hypothetical protein